MLTEVINWKALSAFLLQMITFVSFWSKHLFVCFSFSIFNSSWLVVFPIMVYGLSLLLFFNVKVIYHLLCPILKSIWSIFGYITKRYLDLKPRQINICWYCLLSYVCIGKLPCLSWFWKKKKKHIVQQDYSEICNSCRIIFFFTILSLVDNLFYFSESRPSLKLLLR